MSKRRYLFDYLKTLVASSYEREDFIYGKDRLVMPLDIAMQNAQLKKSQLMSTVLIIFCVLGATIATAFFNHI
jgi:hypothetical protein